MRVVLVSPQLNFDLATGIDILIAASQNGFQMPPHAYLLGSNKR